jgi:hypothetical protein
MKKKETKERKEVPFFARFLEKQEFPRVKSDVKAGPGPWYVTMKWPSDDDEWPTM